MSPFLLSIYILVWPVISAIVLIVLTVGVIKDYRDARRRGEDVV